MFWMTQSPVSKYYLTSFAPSPSSSPAIIQTLRASVWAHLGLPSLDKPNSPAAPHAASQGRWKGVEEADRPGLLPSGHPQPRPGWWNPTPTRASFPELERRARGAALRRTRDLGARAG